MKASQKRDAARSEKFYFRSNVYDANHPKGSSIPGPSSLNLCGSPSSDYTLAQEYPFRTLENNHPDSCELMTLNEIFNGRTTMTINSEKPTFPGLIPLVTAYLNSLPIEKDMRKRLDRYLSLISGRASGKLWTSATWQRDFVQSHPKYQRDSVVSEEIAYDLVKKIQKITNNEEWPVEMFGELEPLAPLPPSQHLNGNHSTDCSSCDEE